MSEGDGAAVRPKLVTRQLLAVIFAGQFFFLGAGVVIPVLPHFVEGTLGGGSLAVGVVVGSFAFSAVLTRPLAGRLGNQHGRRLLMIVGGIIAGSSIATYGLAPNVLVLVVLRLVTGVGEGFFFTGSATLIADLAPKDRRGEALSYFSVAVYLGLGLGPMLGQALFDSNGPKTAFVVAGMMSGIGALLSTRTSDVVTTLPQSAVRQPLINRKALGPGSVLGLGLMGFTAFAAFVPLYTEQQLDLGGSQYVFLLYAGIVLTVRLLGARLPDRLGALRSGSIATVFIAMGLGIVALVPTPAGLYGGTVVLAVGMALQYPALMAMAVNRATDEDRSSVVGTFTASFDLAQGAGGLILGSVAALAGYRAAFAGGALCAVGAFVLLQLVVGRDMGAAPAGTRPSDLLAEADAWLPPGAD